MHRVGRITFGSSGTGSLFDQRRKFFPLAFVPSHGPSQQPDGDPRALRLEPEPALLPTRDFDALGIRPDPELHVKRTEKAFGDWYSVCSCGFVSLPLVSEPLRWDCPVEDGETERARNRQRFRARLLSGR